MNALIRNKSVANRPQDVQLISIDDMLAITDRKERDKCLKHLVQHLVQNKCSANGCHQLSQVLSQLVSSMAHFQTCDQSIDRLLNDMNLYQMDDQEVERKYFELMSETINLKPIKCQQMVDTLIVPKFFGGYREFTAEQHIQPRELRLFESMHGVLSAIKVAKFESTFLSSIERKFPFLSRMSSIHLYVCYVYNTLEVYDYVTNKHKLIAFTFSHLLDIDSTISSKKSDTFEEVFAIDVDTSASKCDTNDNKAVDILDNLIQLLLDFIDKKFTVNTKEQNEEMFVMFKHILSSEVLSVVSSHHLPYIWLYLSSLSNQFMEQLIEYLWDLGINREAPVDTRQKSLYFISSLVKNANFVSTNMIIAFMNTCSLWIHRYIDQNDRVVDELTNEDSIFYNLCQILFDIFCSIHTDLDNLSLRRVKAMNFQRIIKCQLNPVPICHPDIESNFLCLARHYQIGYCSAMAADLTDSRLERPYNPLNNGSYKCPKTLDKIQNLCKHTINIDNSFKENNSFNRFNTSDDSDHMFGSYKLSYSPSKTLWQNLLSDSSPNEHMDCD